VAEFAWLAKQDCAGGMFHKRCKKIRNCKEAIVQQNNADHKSNENAVAGLGRLNIPVVNKSVTAEVNKVENEVAAS